MLRWSELAEWRGPTAARGGAMLEQRGLVVHIAEGSYEGTIAWQKGSNNVSSHFVVASPADAHDGRIAQVVDLDVAAWTQRSGNGRWLSVENSGFSPHELSAAQVESNAQLYARGMQDFGWPAKLATSPADHGLAYHGIACAGPGGDPRAPWVVPNTTGQVWGHCDCPGAGVIAQLPAILARAIEINTGAGSDDMGVMRYQFDPAIPGTPTPNPVLITDGIRYRPQGLPAAVNQLVTSAGYPPITQVTKAMAGALDYARCVKELCGTLDPGEQAGGAAGQHTHETGPAVPTP
jgi:N-acetylmuramoyl-L-alanine amidase